METNDKLSQQPTPPTDKYQQVTGWFAFSAYANIEEVVNSIRFK